MKGSLSTKLILTIITTGSALSLIYLPADADSNVSAADKVVITDTPDENQGPADQSVDNWPSTPMLPSVDGASLLMEEDTENTSQVNIPERSSNNQINIFGQQKNQASSQKPAASSSSAGPVVDKEDKDDEVKSSDSPSAKSKSKSVTQSQKQDQVEFAIGNVRRGTEQNIANKAKSWNGAGIVAVIGLASATGFTLFAGAKLLIAKFF